MAAKVKYTIDLRDVFNRAFSDKGVIFRNKARPLISDMGIKRLYGIEVIDRIVERTEAGKDKNNEKFQAYSDAYKKSLEFKVYGKSSKVNLTLSGEMLTSMAPEEGSGQKVVIEFVDDTNNDKAHGHIHGTKIKKGKNKGETHLPKRDFFGLPKEEEEAILKKVIKESNRLKVIQSLADLAGQSLGFYSLGSNQSTLFESETAVNLEEYEAA